VNANLVDDIANAVLYEGYMLYPYRLSAVKNRQRWNFGVLYPRAFADSQQGADRWSMQTECLVRTAGSDGTVHVRVRFLQLMERSVEEQAPQGWQEGKEREVSIHGLHLSAITFQPAERQFQFAGGFESDESISRRVSQIDGVVNVEAQELENGLFRVLIQVLNTRETSDGSFSSREQALMQSLASAHTIVEVEGGEFISMIDPPERYGEAVAQCKNLGTWPVLVGEPGERNMMLSSPIILYDYPQIAPESAGALFDGTEIDEILTLRIMTLTDEEKVEMRHGDEHARQILERTESMPPEQLMKMHGALRGFRRAGQEMP